MNVSDTLMKERNMDHGIEEGSKEMEATEAPGQSNETIPSQ